MRYSLATQQNYVHCVVAQGMRLTSMIWVYGCFLVLCLWLLGVHLPLDNLVFLLPNGRVPDSKLFLWMLVAENIIFAWVGLIWLDTISLGGKRLWKNIPRLILAHIAGRKTLRLIVFVALGLISLSQYDDALSRISPEIERMIVLLVAIALLYSFRLPAAILLAPSRPESEEFLEIASTTLWPLRSIAFLEGRQVALGSHMLGGDNLRTFDLVGWRRYVQLLVHTLPFIVIDGRHNSDSVAEEVKWCGADTSTVLRTTFVTTDSGTSPLLDAISDEALNTNFALATLHEAPYLLWSRH
jgi:hypothetical protein